ncbi:TlpA disulfide reductase family protein [Parasphingorhabdus sp.]|uniref:TlpA disulfide reductase family protein n=1 Tax=Parasphingorhabdus sp. TaxID=2709688 RepID=UPI002F92AA60
MTNIVQLGPFMFAADRLFAVALLVIFTLAVGKIGEKTGRDAAKAALWALVAGILAARFAYIVLHLEAYSQDWWLALAFWQGGFSVWAGIAIAAVVMVMMLGINRTSGFSLAVIAALSLAWAGGNVLLRSPPQALPDMPVLITLEGGKIEPESLRGRPFVINLWATWCPPCRRELPMLADVAASSDVPILLVNQAEPAEQVERYLTEANIASDAIALDQDGELMRILEGGALPTTLFIDERGDIVATHLGEISRAALLDQISQLEKK